MKRKRLFFAGFTLVLLLALTPTVGRSPFRGLDASDIRSASVKLLPPDVTIQLDRAEIATLASLLREVRVTRRDDSYPEYDGQMVRFTLTLTDGTTREVGAYNPFLIIDGRGWRTAYEPCEALNAFGNRLNQ